ncbi:ester cyclase [Streptomyces sp. NPDC053048]|uniref:ester cyclase n=1 Tax=Streptomyces sp. NPDC053048 TaxID=3365694 RepID=UPI0037CDEB8C
MFTYDAGERNAFLEEWAKSLSTGEATAPLRFYADDALVEDMAMKKSSRGPQELKALLQRLYDAAPDTRIVVRRCLTAPTHGVVHWTWTGTLSGKLYGFTMSAPEPSFSVEGVTVVEFADDGRIASEADYWNAADLLHQVGAVAV